MPGQIYTRSRDEIRNAARLAAWTLAWVATLALATFGPRFLWDFQPVASWIAIAINLVAGIGLIVFYGHYLRGLDELQRKINLDAMAIALGVGLVVGCSYASANSSGLIAFDANIAFVTVLMSVAYMVAIAVGHLRYR